MDLSGVQPGQEERVRRGLPTAVARLKLLLIPILYVLVVSPDDSWAHRTVFFWAVYYSRQGCTSDVLRLLSFSQL